LTTTSLYASCWQYCFSSKSQFIAPVSAPFVKVSEADVQLRQGTSPAIINDYVGKEGLAKNI